MFKFYYQTGEFQSDSSSFIQDIAVQVIAWILAFITAYFIVRRQQALYKTNKQEERDRIEIDKLIYLSYLVNKSIPYTKNLLDSIDKFINEIEIDYFNIGNLEYDIEDNLTRLADKVDQEDYFHAFRNQLNKNDLSTVFYGIDVIKATKEELFSYMSKHKLEVDYSRKKEFFELIVNARDKLRVKLREIKENGEKGNAQYEIYNYFLVKHINVSNNSPNDLNLQFKEFILPFRDKIVEDISNDINTIEKEIGDNIIFAYWKYNEITRSNKIFIDNIKERVIQIQKALDSVKNASRMLIDKYND